MVTGKAMKRARKHPVGDRIQFLTTMSAKVIKDVKQAALDDGMNGWQIMEEAAKEWLARRKTKKKAEAALKRTDKNPP